MRRQIKYEFHKIVKNKADNPLAGVMGLMGLVLLSILINMIKLLFKAK